MTYIYDMITDEYQLVVKRYGVRYKLENRVNVGGKPYFLYSAKGHDKILIIPQFAKQYFEIREKFDDIDPNKSYKEFCYWLKRVVGNDYTVEKSLIGSGQDQDTVYDITAQYKDIEIYFTLSHEGVSMQKLFEIVKNNVFGKGVVVSMDKRED